MAWGFEQLFWSQTVSEIVFAFVPGVSFTVRERSAIQTFMGTVSSAGSSAVPVKTVDAEVGRLSSRIWSLFLKSQVSVECDSVH